MSKPSDDHKGCAKQGVGSRNGEKEASSREERGRSAWSGATRRTRRLLGFQAAHWLQPSGHEAPAESASCTMIGQRHVENPSPECCRATTMRRCPTSPFAFRRTCACTPPQAIFYQYFVPGPKALVRGRDVIHSPPSFAVPRNKPPQAYRAPCTIRTSLHLANNPLPCNQSII